MSKIDYSKEYREMLDAFVDGTPNDIASAVYAMGIKIDPNETTDLIQIIVRLNDYFIIDGFSANTATCVLRDENATF